MFGIFGALRRRKAKAEKKGSELPGPRGSGWLAFWVTIVIILAAILSVWALVRQTEAALGPPPLDRLERMSVTAVDRNGDLLRPFTTAGGYWRLPVKLDEVDQDYIRVLLAFEDQNFYTHGGIDFAAVVRAAGQAVENGRVVSGASTLTMQAARLLDGKHERTLAGKWRQMIRARQLERQFSKQEILEIYLRLAPFGGNVEGVRAASWAYFGKEPRRLSLGQAALLVALPQSPEGRRLDRYANVAKKARDRVLARAVDAGLISEDEAKRAMLERVPSKRLAFPRFAPHLTDAEVAAFPKLGRHRLTLDRSLQSRLEILATEQARLQGDALSAAIVVADHTTGEILAHVGSAGYLSKQRGGGNDMVQAVRSPGSTLKPFVYGLSFDAGFAHPETLIEDRPSRFGDYAPKNFDNAYHGTMSVRDALMQSLNIPAVKTLARVGPGRLAARFRRAGVVARFPAGTAPTLAMALGGTGLTLKDLTRLYSALARGGESIRLSHRVGARLLPETQKHAAGLKQSPSRHIMSPVAAWYVSDILKDAPPPPNAQGGTFAYKTGTSYGYRDAWAVGYDGQHVVAVWIGRADGESVPGMMGRTAAAPILFDAFKRISGKRVPLAPAPNGVIASRSSADLPKPLQRWRSAGEPALAGAYLESDVKIAFPPPASEIDRTDYGKDALRLKADGGVLPLTWLVDGAPLAAVDRSREAYWQPEGAGFVKLTVIDAEGKVDRVDIRVR